MRINNLTARVFTVSVLTGLFLLFSGGMAVATNYAGLVVRHGDGSAVTRCVAFDEPSISGIELLSRSGLSIVTESSGYGVAVYGIDGEGTVEDWKTGRGSWGYWHLRGGWAFSSVGASSYQVKPGDVEGWSWGSQTSPSAPPIYTYEELYSESYGAPANSGSTGNAGAAPAPGGTQGSAQPGADKTQAASSGSAVTENKTLAGKNAAAKPGSATTAKARQTARDNSQGFLFFGLILGGLSSMIGYYSLKNRFIKT